MKEDNLDRILKSEEELVPSSGFVAAVMERVREEAAAPAPIPFPWKRLAPGLGLQDLRATALVQPHLSAALTGTVGQAGWVALALGVSMLAWILSRRMVGRSGLL